MVPPHHPVVDMATVIPCMYIIHVCVCVCVHVHVHMRAHLFTTVYIYKLEKLQGKLSTHHESEEGIFRCS